MIAKELAAFIPWNLYQGPLPYIMDCRGDGDNLLNDEPLAKVYARI
jgi:hypothetical protein